MPELDTYVFLLPAEMTKNGEERIVVLNRIAKGVVESERGRHPTYVFSYQGKRLVRKQSRLAKGPDQGGFAAGPGA